MNATSNKVNKSQRKKGKKTHPKRRRRLEPSILCVLTRKRKAGKKTEEAQNYFFTLEKFKLLNNVVCFKHFCALGRRTEC